MTILGAIIIGFFVGLIARLLKPGRDSMGIIMTTVLGIAGAVLGGLLGRVLGFYGPEEPAGLIAATIGAILILFAARAISRRQRTI